MSKDCLHINKYRRFADEVRLVIGDFLRVRDGSYKVSLGYATIIEAEERLKKLEKDCVHIIDEIDCSMHRDFRRRCA